VDFARQLFDQRREGTRPELRHHATYRDQALGSGPLVLMMTGRLVAGESLISAKPDLHFLNMSLF
jgi:hypothetical protein